MGDCRIALDCDQINAMRRFHDPCLITAHGIGLGHVAQNSPGSTDLDSRSDRQIDQMCSFIKCSHHCRSLFVFGQNCTAATWKDIIMLWYMEDHSQELDQEETHSTLVHPRHLMEEIGRMTTSRIRLRRQRKKLRNRFP